MSTDNDLYNADELIAPDWLNNHFFQKILTQKYAGKCVIRDIKITPGTTKSDHYGSVMFRARVKYATNTGGRDKEKSFIIKTAPTMEGEKKETLKNYSLFETEIKMYSETLPKIESILRQHGDNTKLYADIFYYSLDPHKCLIFEDLVELGYTTISQRYCDIEEVKAALLKIAKIHAVSHKLAMEGDTSIIAYDEGTFSDAKIMEFKFIKEGFSILKENLKKYKDLSHFLPRYEKIETNILQRIIDSFNAYKNGKRDGIFVLNHGDFHMKNLMVKRTDSALEDLILVDFQISVFGSPAIDIIYAFIMLFSPELRQQHRDELFYYYFSNFQETLKFIGFTGHIPTMIEFHKEILDHGHWEIFLASSFILTNYIFPDPTADLAKFVEDPSYRKELWVQKDIMKEMHELLPFYLYKGYFEN